MADQSGINPFVFPCKGGLVLDRSTFTMEAGMALELQNFEADIQVVTGVLTVMTSGILM